MLFFFPLSVSLGAAGVVVGHEAESVHHRGQLFKLLPAKHPRLPGAEDQQHEQKGNQASLPKPIFLSFLRPSVTFDFLHLVTAGGMTRTQSNLFAFSVSHTCFTRWTSSLQKEKRYTRAIIRGEKRCTLKRHNSLPLVASQLAPQLQGEPVETFRLQCHSVVKQATSHKLTKCCRGF